MAGAQKGGGAKIDERNIDAVQTGAGHNAYVKRQIFAHLIEQGDPRWTQKG